MYQYYVVEVLKNTSGEFEHNVFWLYDEDDTTARLKAESKYHEILSNAAISTNLTHSAIMFSSTADALGNWCYTHEVETE